MGLFGVTAAYSPHSDSSLSQQSNASLSSPILISSRHTTGGIPPGLRGSLHFLALKSDGLFSCWLVPECRAQRNRSREWPSVGWDGAFYFSRKVFLVNLIFLPWWLQIRATLYVRPGFDAHNLKPPSKISSALRCFFSWSLNSTAFLFHQGSWEEIQAQLAGSLPNLSNCNFILSTGASCYQLCGSLQGVWEEGESTPQFIDEDV